MMPRSRLAAILGMSTMVFLLIVIGLRPFSYPYFPDNSDDIGADDGYPYYARHLDTVGTLLPEYRRLPGYPLFLVASKHLTGFYYSKAGHYVQGVLSLLVIAILVRPLRRTFGSLITIILLALLALPNLWTSFVAFSFPDFLSALVFGAFVMLAFHWIANPSRGKDLRYGAVISVVIASMVLLKAGSTILIVTFAVGLVAAQALTARGWTALSQIAIRAVGLVVVAFLLQLLIIATCGSGSLEFYRYAIHAKVATYLPPAADTVSERIVERAKDAISARMGQRIEDENFTNELAIVQPSVEKVWWGRLKARPFAYLGVMLDELRRKHYLVAASFSPYMPDISPYQERIPPKEDTMASRVYRTTGFSLPGFGAGFRGTVGALADGLLRTVLFWAPLIGGLIVLYRRWRFPVLTLLISLAAYVVVLAFGIFINGRYLLPFAPLIYLAQACGFAWFVTLFSTPSRDRAGSPSH